MGDIDDTAYEMFSSLFMKGAMMKRKIFCGVLILSLLISHYVTFWISAIIADRKAWKIFIVETEKKDADIWLTYYIEYRDLAADIKLKRHDNIKCRVDLSSSSYFDTVSYYFEKNRLSPIEEVLRKEGRLAIEKRVLEEAPEILDEEKRKDLPFEYIKQCKSSITK